MTNQSTNEASAAETGDRVQRARERRARDDQWLSAAKRGDADAYRQLVTEWSSGAFDRALHRGADERSAADSVLRLFTSLQGQLVDDDTSFGARVMGAIERDVPARPHALGKANRGAKRAAERLTRGTDPAALGADPSISVMLWDALDVLGDRARDITDLHWRHGLASDEIAAATGESVFRVDDIIRKAPQGLGAALRTRLLWAGGKPDHDELTRDLKSNNVRQFDSAAVRVIHGHLRACSVCRSRSLIALPAIEIFEAVPLVALPADVERRISTTAWAPFASGAAAATFADAEPAVAEAAPEAEVVPEHGTDAANGGNGTNGAGSSPEPEPALPAESKVSSEGLEPREHSTAAETTIAGSVAAAGAAAAAFLGATTDASASTAVEAPPLAAAPAPLAPPEPTTAPTPIAPAPIAPAPIAPAGATDTTLMPLGALTQTPPPPVAPAGEVRGTGPAHEPVASRAPDRDGRPKWLIPACVSVAAVIILGLVVVFTRGGDDKKTAIDAGATVESTTTTRAPSSTTSTTAAPPVTAPATVTTAPPTTAPSTTAGGGGGNNTGGGAPPTTKPPAVIANVQYSMSPATIYAGNAGATLQWSVAANGPITVEVTGPGVSSSSPSGSTSVCGTGSTCNEAGTYYFSIVAKDADGRQVGAGTAKLIVRD